MKKLTWPTYHVGNAVGMSNEKTHNSLYVNIDDDQSEIVQSQRQHTATKSHHRLFQTVFSRGMLWALEHPRN